MDVFRFNEDVNKSVIAFPENCQTCGQCYVYCLGHSLALSGEAYGFPITSVRAASKIPMNRQLLVSDTPKNRMIMPAIATVLGAMFAHNAIVWSGKNARRGGVEVSAEPPQVESQSIENPMMTRMNTNQRWQHLTMLVSFIALVITGFSIRFSASKLVHMLGMGTPLCGIIHRTAGVLLICTGIYHLLYVTLARNGRRLLRDMAPRPNDVSNVWGTIRYYLGLRQEKPKFGRFTYAEKAEYWMLVVGTVSMSLTGTMLWAYIRTGHLLSDWWLSLARAFHFYEAILASLAVVIWHFYQVFVDPDNAPMNHAWLDGKMPVEHYRREHELDAEWAPEEQSERELDAELAPEESSK
jgi:formate dehydrogenase gamma subunit